MALLIDGLIIIVYFVAITAIGLYMGRREHSLHDFALGGRKVPWWAVMASIIAAETSAATFLGTPGEGFDKKNLAYVQLVFGLILGRMIVGYVFLKPYYAYKVYTVYDYLGVRFGPRSKSFISGLFLIMRTLASGTRLFIPSLVMVLAWRLFTDGSVEYSQTAVTSVWPYLIAITLLTILTCAYTAIGGIKAVIWTDVFQAALMFGSAIIAIVTLLQHIGGIGPVLEAAPALGRLDGYILTGFENKPPKDLWDGFKTILASDYTIFTALIGSTLGSMAAFGTDQDMVQRMLSSETYQKARRSMITSAIMDIPIAAAFTFIGILLFAYYQMEPKFLPVDATGKAVNSDVFGNYILNVMPVGIRGLVLAGVFATAMGSFSAALNALATSATNDWYIPRRPGKTEEHYVKAARIFTVIFALLMIVIAGGFAYAKVNDPNIRIIPVVLGIANFILGPMLGVFLIGMFTKNRGSDRGNVIAVICGLTATIFLGDLHITFANLMGPAFGMVEPWARPEWLPKISFMWFAMIGAVVVFTVGMFFKTPPEVLEEAKRQAEEAASGDDRPMAMRDQPRISLE